MVGSERNRISVICPKCGAKVIVKEVNDGSPARTYEVAMCPKCSEQVYEKYIVGAFEAELENKDE